MLVSFRRGRLRQLRGCFAEEEALLCGDGSKDPEFLGVIGCAAMNARTCFTAFSELSNKWRERDSLSFSALITYVR